MASQDDNLSEIDNSIIIDMENLDVSTVDSTNILDSFTSGISDSNINNVDLNKLDTDATIKYLNGEIPFEQYQNILESSCSVNILNEEDNFLVGSEEIVSNDSEQKDEEDENEPYDLPHMKRRKHRKTRLDKHLQGLMGEANLKFAKQEYDECIKMCMEVIRLVPTAHEPFQTLGMLYEDRGDSHKSFQFLLIACHLNPSDKDEWLKLAEISLEQNNIKQAILCFSKAIKCDFKNLSLHHARIDLYKKLGESKKVLECHMSILKVLSDLDGEEYIKHARDLAKRMIDIGETNNAMTILSNVFKNHPLLVDAEDVNLILELYISQKKYELPLRILVDNCGVQLSLDNGDIVSANDGYLKFDKSMEIVKCDILDELPIDLQVKLVVCLIHLGHKHCAQLSLMTLFEENPDDVGDLYLDVADAYMATGNYSEAKPILFQLCQSENYNLALVWLKYAECLNSLRLLDDAADAYCKVIDLAPSHMSARVSLSAIQQQQGKYEEALATLDLTNVPTHDPPPDLNIDLPRCLILLSHKRIEEFIIAAKRALFYFYDDLFHPKFKSLIIGIQTMKHRSSALKSLLGEEYESRHKDTYNLLVSSTFNANDLWDIYMQLCQILIDLDRLEEFLDVSVMALIHPHFMSDLSKSQEAEFICLTASMLNKNGQFAYRFIREMCVNELHNNQAWNLFCYIISLSQDNRHNRFCMRMMIKHPNNIALGILNGHNALVAGTYKHALGEYVNALQQDPKKHYHSFFIGLTFLHMACQKFSAKRHSLIIQAISFFNHYSELRGDSQETYYNLGRAMHQLGLGHAAVFYYEKALTYECEVKGQEALYDLKKEIAFNLSLIYQSSGSYDLASMVIQKYIVI